jgi:membrane fusion protein, heavy metal efflux system
MKKYNTSQEKNYNAMKNPTYNSKTRFIKQLFAITILLVFVSSCKKTDKAIVEKEQFCLSETLKNQIEFHEVYRQTVKQYINLNGKVEANPEKEINFVSLVEGIVVNTYFTLGEEVQKGQVLAEIRSTELSGLQAENRTLTSQLIVAKRQLASVKSMHEDGIASERDLLQAKSEVDVLEAELKKTTTNLNLFSSSGTSGVFQIKAPSTGIIIQNNLASGLQITEGDSLFTISDLSKVWVSINVYAGNLTAIQQNMEVDIKTLSYPDEVFKGSIAAMSQVFDTEERVLKARVVMENKDLKLKPGMLVDVLVKKESDQEAFVIPTAALIFDKNQNYFIVYKDGCNITRRSADILTENNGLTYLNSGITEDELVISKNQLIVFEQLKNQ